MNHLDQVIRWKSPKIVLAGFFGANSVAAVLIARALLSSEAVSANLPGRISPRLLALAELTLALGLGLGVLAIIAWIKPSWCERLWRRFFGNSRTAWGFLTISGSAFAMSAIGALTPSVRFGEFAGYFSVLHPLLAWFAILSGAALFIAMVQIFGVRWRALKVDVQSQKRGLLAALALFVMTLVLWALITRTGIGIRSNEDMWYGAGAPLLFQQLLVSIVFATLIFLAERRLSTWLGRRSHAVLSLDFWMFFLIWFAGALIWALQPTPSNFTALSPLPPNHELYPFADALRYDLGGQFALIGQGINGGKFYYRIFYMGYLFVLHGLFGQDYIRLMAAQAALFAVLPAVVYLLGKETSNRTFGILAASMIFFRGLNSIPASGLVDVSAPKQMLTDFPAALGVIGFSLLLVLWLKKPEKISHLFWAAGVLGLTASLRTTAIGLLPALLLLMWLVKTHAWTWKIPSSILVLALFLASAFPWSLWYGRSVFDVYAPKVNAVLNTRYEIDTPAPTVSPVPVKKPPQEFILDHFAHNLVTSVLSLPPSPIFNDLRQVVRVEFPYWDTQWDGSLDENASKLFLVLNLAVLCLGLGFAFRASGMAGLAPFIVFLGYSLTTSVGRTSGGRYIVPMDWVATFYFAWGVMILLRWGNIAFTSRNHLAVVPPAPYVPNPPARILDLVKQGFPGFLAFFSVSAAMIFLSALIPARYTAQSKSQLFAAFVRDGYVHQTGFDAQALNSFIAQEQAGIWSGRALYPRFFGFGQGINVVAGVFQKKDYPRLVFSLIGPAGSDYVMLPGAALDYFPNAADVMVIGCRVDNKTIQAITVVVLDDNPNVYSLPPQVELQCPLKASDCQEDSCR